MADVGKAAESASMIVCGYAFTPAEGGRVRVLNLNSPDKAMVIGPRDEVLETTMDDIEMRIVLDYYLDNREFMEVNVA